MTQDPERFFPWHHRSGLFRSAAWQEAWREHWGLHPAISPLSEGSEQLAEFYRFRQFKRGLFPIRTAFPAGTSSPVAKSVRCEYFCFPRSSENLKFDIASYLKSARRHAWDQLHLPDLLADSEQHLALLEAAREAELYVSEREREPVFAVDFRQSSFEHYVKSLGKNTRLKLFNRRQRLAQEGEVKIENIWPDREAFYVLLNEFHQKRWGKPCYQGRNLKFIDSLLVGLAQEGKKVDLSVMTLGQKPVSVVLDITAQGRCYNLQSGYLEELIKGVSLGTLHFGYQIESAYADGAEMYDFMAGSGKNSQYKNSFANTQSEFVSLMLVRNPLLKLAYKFRA